MDTETPLKALALVCTLSSSPADSSSEKLAKQVLTELKTHNIEGTIIRAVDYDIKPGVEADMGGSDDWPMMRAQMLAADILLIATPTWVGHMSSVAQRIIERLDAELSDTDEAGRLRTYGKIAAVAVVGNEDGAHKITADLLQALNDVGFTIPANASTYWNGEAMQKVDYKDLVETPQPVATANKTLASNAAHLARLLKQNEYPAV